ncbi:MAG: agmatine deiminase family protein [Muribaculaceae bacterium]|nr:agmatine deiminase family protein [Muribaculaceae bacterium]
MNTKMNERRLPSEWEPQQAVLMAWPHAQTDWEPILPDVLECYGRIVKAISEVTPVIVVGPERLCNPSFTQAGFNPARVTFIDIPTNDTWTRDYGPITIADGSGLTAIDFKFNGWGLKFAADRDNLVNLHLYSLGLLPGTRENRLGFVLEGGSIESDGRGTILTTSECLLSPNRNGDLDRQQIEERLHRYLGASHVLWLDHGALAGDDTDSHIDTLARLAPDDTIIYCGPGEEGDPNNPGLEAMKEQLKTLLTPAGQPYHLVELPLPAPIYDSDGMQLPATYANYLVSNGTVFVPTYGQLRKDTLAAMMIQSVYHTYRIVPLDCRALIQQHGSLHCASMQFPTLHHILK